VRSPARNVAIAREGRMRERAVSSAGIRPFPMPDSPGSLSPPGPS
jgi:hypothetical protein